jgi:thioredoxin 1
VVEGALVVFDWNEECLATVMSASVSKHFTTKSPGTLTVEEMPADHQRTPESVVSSAGIRTVTSATFDQWVLDGKGPIVVEFMSYGCVHCRAMEPILQQVAEMVKSKVQIFRVNTAVEQELTESCQVQGTPTLIMFLQGREVGRFEGPSPTVEGILAAVTQPFES